MRRLASTAIVLMLAAPAAAQPVAVRVQIDPSTDSAPSEKLAAPIEQCIRDNASKVEIAVSDLNEAVTFLVDNLCAQPIAEESARRAKRAAEQYQKQIQDACDKEKTQPDGDPARQYACACAISNATHIGFTGIDQYNAGSVQGPPAGVALASKLLLDLRLSHSKPGQPR